MVETVVSTLLTRGEARRIAANIAKLLSKDGGRRIAAPGSEPKFVATVLAPKDAQRLGWLLHSPTQHYRKHPAAKLISTFSHVWQQFLSNKSVEG